MNFDSFFDQLEDNGLSLKVDKLDSKSDKLLDKGAQDLRGLGKMIRGSDDLTRLIRSPVISREDQGRAAPASGG